MKRYMNGLVFSALALSLLTACAQQPQGEEQSAAVSPSPAATVAAPTEAAPEEATPEEAAPTEATPEEAASTEAPEAKDEKAAPEAKDEKAAPKAKDEKAAPEAAPEAKVVKDKMGNPMKPSDKETFTKMGIKLSDIGGAKDVKMYTINNDVAQLSFEFESQDYCYRGSKKQKDISGIHGTPEGKPITNKAVNGKLETTVTVQGYKEGYQVASWKWKDINYTLTYEKGEKPIKPADFAAFAQQLAAMDASK